MNLYIIRHGESTWNKENKIQGHSNPCLSKTGLLQARFLAKRFADIKVDRLYSSPLLRSYQTARAVSSALKLKIIKKEGLKEIGLGEWESKTPDEIDRLYDNKYLKWLKVGPTKVRIPGAEGISIFRKRIDRAFADIIRENSGRDNIVVVTHGGVIASFLARLIRADFDRLILKLHLPNTCVTLVSFEEGRGCLIHIADTFHLPKRKIKDLWPAKSQK
jgi:probable phosphoglycerate mutase